MKKHVIIKLLVLVALYGSVVFAEEGNKNKDRVIWLATEISGYFDSSPDPKYWKELHGFGSQAIPIVAELTHTEENRNNPRMLLVLSQLKGNDQLIASELRRYLENTHENVDLKNENTFKMALRCLSRIGEQEDVAVIQRFECHTNIYISATAKRAHQELVQRLDSITNRVVVVESVQAVGMDAVDIPSELEKGSDKKLALEKETDGQPPVSKWTRIVTFVMAAVSGFLLVFFRRWKKR